MEITTLVPQSVDLLAPCLPYLTQDDESAIEVVKSRFGVNTWDLARALWVMLQPKVQAKPALQEAVQDVVDAPNEEDARAALRQQLKKLFTEDSAFANEIAELLSKAKATGNTVTVNGDRAVGIGGGVTTSTIITGDSNVMGDGDYRK